MFENIYGHDSIKARLKSLVTSKDPTGTYLFYGHPSVGKRTTALETARSLLCLKEQSEDCSCSSCKRFNEHPDLMCVGRKTRIKVRNIDAILDFVSRVPFLCSRRVVIMDNADQMTYEAANRLLKTLEEPYPGYCYFLITSNPDQILPTILGRCIKYRFGLLAKDDMINIFWKKMGIDLPKARVLGWIGYRSGMDIFPRASACLTYREMIFELLATLNHKSLLDVLDMVDRVEREDLMVFSDLLLLTLTDVLLLMNGVGDIVNVDQRDLLETLKDRFNKKGLIGAVSNLSQVKRNVHLNVNLSMGLKNTLIKSYPYLVAA